METKHTPGPWSWSTDSMENRCDKTLVSETTGYSILYCCVKPREPNARLIAAAPDLLEALNELANGYSGNRWDVGIALRLKKARAAIAKATGA